VLTTALLVVVLTAVGVLGVCVVLTRDPLRLTVVNGFFGLALVLFFVALQAPDVAISELVVSTVAYPLVLLVTVYRTGKGSHGAVRRQRERAAARRDERGS
jgi:energy-converting hydrogenase B subunit D